MFKFHMRQLSVRIHMQPQDVFFMTQIVAANINDSFLRHAGQVEDGGPGRHGSGRVHERSAGSDKTRRTGLCSLHQQLRQEQHAT
jgi:hypothetical protein